MPTVHRLGSGGKKKHGRNKIKCERYKREHRREKNKLKKLNKLLKNHPHDKCLTIAIKRIML